MRSRGRAASVGVLGALATVATLVVSATAAASPTRWARARSEEVNRAEVTRAEAEAELIADRRERRSPFEDPIVRIESHAPKAARILEDAAAPSSPDWRLRLFAARAFQLVGQWEKAFGALASVISDPATPPVFLADALSDQAVVLARLGRADDEIELYERAIAFEPHPTSRSTLLANQAEAFMVRGDATRAIQGYRAALEQVGNAEAVVLAPTILWSLGVALDRSGDLESGLDAIGRARAYDPNDVRIKGPDWFFVPAYDSHYFAALGEWLEARRLPDREARAAAYEQASSSMEQFLTKAPPTDPYRPVASARLKLLSKEARDRSMQQDDAPKPIGSKREPVPPPKGAASKGRAGRR